MKGERFGLEIIVDKFDNRVPKIGYIETIVTKTDDGATEEKEYKIDKYTSCEVIADGTKLSIWLEATEQ